MNEKTCGVIIKQSDFGEGHRMLWIFTEKYGIVKAVAHGVEKTKSKKGGSTQLLSYSDFDFYGGGDVWNIKSISPKDSFWPIYEDITKLALVTYFADLIYHFLELHNPDTNILRLFLNTLYACAYKDVPQKVMKVVFETKLMFFSGLLPSPANCVNCGGDKNLSFFDRTSGGVVCEDCGSKSTHIKINEETYKVYFIIVCSDLKKMFSYNLPTHCVEKLSIIIENYIMSVTDRSFKSLEYYKNII